MKTKQEKMTAFMVETNMASGSVFGEVMQSLARPKESSLEQAEIPIQQLRRLDFFSALSEDEFQWIVKNATLYDAARHTTIIKEGENDTSLYFIVRGAVQSRLKKQHKVAKLAVMSPLHLFCSTALIDESITIIDFAGCERTFYFKFSPATLLQLSEEHSRLWYQLHDLMYEAIGNLEQAANRLDIRLTSELYNR